MSPMREQCPWLGAAIALHYALFPRFAFTTTPGPAMRIAGMVLIAFGLFTPVKVF
jgi:hypothetical protein